MFNGGNGNRGKRSDGCGCSGGCGGGCGDGCGDGNNRGSKIEMLAVMVVMVVTLAVELEGRYGYGIGGCGGSSDDDFGCKIKGCNDDRY